MPEPHSLALSLPGTSGYEKGYREALESMALALAGKVNAQALKEALDSALDAYANNADKQDNDCVQVDLSIKDDEGNVVDGTTAQLSLEQISSIVDQASDLVIAHRSGQPIDEALAALDEALSESNVLRRVLDLDARIATAHDELASYQFGDDVQVVCSMGWEISDQSCELSNIVYIKNTADTQVDTDSEPVSFQVRFDVEDNVSGVCAMKKNGAEIGRRGNSAAKMREAQASASVVLDARIATADDEFASYEFGDDVRIVDSGNWDRTDPQDFTKIVYFENSDEPQGDTDSERLSFHVRFDDEGKVSEAYGLLMETGADIGKRGNSEAKMREAQALTDVWSTADITRGPRGG